MLIDAVNNYTNTETDMMRKRLLDLPWQWRELLVRYYRDGQSAEEVCAQMDLSEAEFLGIKHEAKSRLTGN